MDFWRFQTADPSLAGPLQGVYDPLLVTLSVMIACFSGLTALMMVDRMISAEATAARRRWHWAGALTLGLGIWSMHFTGMLAFSVEGQPHPSYALSWTLASVLPAILGSGAALHVMAQDHLTRRRLHLGAHLMAAGIGTMHYTGMEAMGMDGLRYDATLFVLSLVVAYLLALVALYLNFRVRSVLSFPGYGLRVAAGIVMGFAVAGMHYTAMAAARFHAGPDLGGDGALFSEAAMAATISGFAGFVLTLGVLATWIDRQRANQQFLEHLVTTDALTGLPNTAFFRQRLDEALADSRRGGEPLAVLFMDLNDFKTINDSLGHTVGDRVLRQLADRLAGSLRPDDTLARFGGDEFVVLARRLDRPAAAEAIAHRFLRALEQPIAIDHQEFHLDASIGISMYPDDGDNAEELIQQADAAMYYAKNHALGYRCFDPSLTEQAMQTMRLGNDLRGAIKHDQLFLEYQPWVDLGTGAWLGLEALTRWSHPREGLISPGVFVPLAERTGVIFQLGEWAIREACVQGRIWLDAGVAFGRIAVNVAAPQVAEESFADTVAAILDDTGLPGACLELEITESSLMDNDLPTLERLRRLRRLGVSLSVDDFGTGFSSLRYLKDLPVDKLKIDKAFIASMLTDPSDQAIIQAVTEMGSRLGYVVVAEGVEGEAQRNALVGLGCPVGQGYLFGRPAGVADVERLFPALAGRQKPVAGSSA
ncbi:EAL domain-containing protein [Aquisalimonas lutea]|uniref:putative bifunctional diguanylate cyclase/phosphodiesterase n=1 Tax=Aquisalimonas lutea TaxID=1327750 RepID=UPI0025B5FBCE|nr:EAL domain-containing protein [Aquisalimonas lutea]MDN3517281.1 EAL domain-containing protein [Aquisalimonas lutea]